MNDNVGAIIDLDTSKVLVPGTLIVAGVATAALGKSLPSAVAGVAMVGLGAFLATRTGGEAIDPANIQEDRSSLLLVDSQGGTVWKPGDAYPIPVAKGERIWADFSFTNISDKDLTPRFRLDIRQKFGVWGPVSTWQEGEWTPTSTVQPGQVASISVPSRAIPTDWPYWDPLMGDQTVDVRLMLDGAQGDWWYVGDDLLHVAKLEYQELHCNYDDVAPDGQPQLDKADGDPFWGTIAFQHKGPPEALDIYLGLNCAAKYVWTDVVSTTVQRDQDWTTYTLAVGPAYVDGANLTDGANIEAKKLVMPSGIAPAWNTSSARLSDPDWPYIYRSAVAPADFSLQDWGVLVNGELLPPGMTTLAPGSYPNVGARLTVKNNGAVAATIDVFGALDPSSGSPLEGPLTSSPIIQPGQALTFDIGIRVIPIGWVDVTVDVFLVRSGIYGRWATKSGVIYVSAAPPSLVSFSAFLGAAQAIPFAQSLGADYWSLGWTNEQGTWLWSAQAPLDYGITMQNLPAVSSFFVRLHRLDPNTNEVVDIYVSPQCGPATLANGGQLWVNNIPGCSFTTV